MHDAHASAETHTTTTTSAATGAAWLSSFESAFSKSLVLLTGWVTDGLIDGQNDARGLTSCCQHIEAHDLGFPHEFIEHVTDVSIEDIDSLPEPLDWILHVFLSQLVKDVC